MTAWLTREPDPQTTTHLLCFPGAGQPVQAFTPWSIPGVDILPVLLPGRGKRRHEPFPTSINEVAARIAEDVVTRLPGKVALFGHSAGTWVAHAVAEELTARQHPPVSMTVASLPPPPSTLVKEWAANVTDDEIEQIFVDGLPSMRAASARRFVRTRLPAIRADCHALLPHQPSGKTLPCPVTVIAGQDDFMITADELVAWRHVTSHTTTLHLIPGIGHFVVPERGEDVQNLVRTHLTTSCMVSDLN